MVTFEPSMGGCEVKVDGKLFGYISEERGYFTSPASIHEFVEVSPDELRQIADKAEEMRKSFKAHEIDNRRTLCKSLDCTT